jgi:hypothetical protein
MQALAVVIGLSTLAVLGGSVIGGFAGTFIVYLFLLVPIFFIGVRAFRVRAWATLQLQPA